MKTALAPILLFVALTAPAATFTPAASMSVARAFHTATVLQDGRVFIAGGTFADATCEIYDPATGTFRLTASMTHPRIRHSATLLNDGRVLIAGGNVKSAGDLPAGTNIDYTAEVFDPRTETFTRAGNLITARYAQSAALLPDGKVLLTGGAEQYNNYFGLSFRPQPHDEIFDPLTNSFSAAPDMQTSRWYHTATALPDGKVLVVGFPPGTETALPKTELFDSQGKTVQSVTGGAARMLQTATLLADGRVLLAGGTANLTDPTSEVYQPSTRTFQSVSGISTASSGHTATLLTDGRVLMTGWTDSGSASATAVIFDPSSNSIAATASMSQARRGQTASRLPGGKVLITGGSGATTEIFDPQSTVTAVGRRRAARP